MQGPFVPQEMLTLLSNPHGSTACHNLCRREGPVVPASRRWQWILIEWWSENRSQHLGHTKQICCSDDDVEIGKGSRKIAGRPVVCEWNLVAVSGM